MALLNCFIKVSIQPLNNCYQVPCTLLYMIAFLIRFGMAVQVAVRFYIILGWVLS
nr:MAG TPA: hypothetical protein [Caudoviricetes sp.]